MAGSPRHFSSSLHKPIWGTERNFYWAGRAWWRMDTLTMVERSSEVDLEGPGELDSSQQEQWHLPQPLYVLSKLVQHFRNWETGGFNPILALPNTWFWTLGEYVGTQYSTPEEQSTHGTGMPGAGRSSLNSSNAWGQSNVHTDTGDWW